MFAFIVEHVVIKFCECGSVLSQFGDTDLFM